MLPRLFLRDWILHRRIALLSFGIFGAFQIFSVSNMSSPRVWLIFASFYAAFLAVVVFVREDKFRATGWGCTLPVTRRELVLARFIESWIMVLVALTGALLLAALLPGSAVSPHAVLQPTSLLICATIVTLVLALMQPFTIRYGFLGVMIFVIGMQVLGVVVLTFATATRPEGGGSGRPILDALSSLGDRILAVREALSPTGFALVVVLSLVALNWAGYRLAVFMFRRREL